VDPRVASGPRARPAIRVAVVIDREREPNRWQDWRFTIAERAKDFSSKFPTISVSKDT